MGRNHHLTRRGRPGSAQRALRLLPLALAAAAAPLAALDDEFGGFSDLRLNIHAYGVAYDVDYVGINEQNSFDLSWRFGATWIASLGLAPGRGGLLVGLGFNYSFMDAELNNNAQVDLQSWSAQGYFGWGWPIGDNFQVEVLPMVGFGRVYLDIDNTALGLSDMVGQDKLVEGGIMANAIWTLRNSMQVGLTFGYLLTDTSVVDESAGVRFDWNTANPTIAFIFGSRL